MYVLQISSNRKVFAIYIIKVGVKFVDLLKMEQKSFHLLTLLKARTNNKRTIQNWMSSFWKKKMIFIHNNNIPKRWRTNGDYIEILWIISFLIRIMAKNIYVFKHLNAWAFYDREAWHYIFTIQTGLLVHCEKFIPFMFMQI